MDEQIATRIGMQPRTPRVPSRCCKGCAGGICVPVGGRLDEKPFPRVGVSQKSSAKFECQGFELQLHAETRERLNAISPVGNTLWPASHPEVVVSHSAKEVALTLIAPPSAVTGPDRRRCITQPGLWWL